MRYNHPEEMGITLQVYPCDKCGKEFRSKSNLRQHMEAAHSDSPNPKYKCHICFKQLKQDNSWRKHMANAHGVGERCKFCDKLYKNTDALNRHLKLVHPKMQEDLL